MAIAIIGILIAVLRRAVQPAREAKKRRNPKKVLGLCYADNWVADLAAPSSGG